MEQSLQKYYEETFSTMSTEGWKYLIEDLKKLEENLVNVRTVKDEQSLNYRLGQLDILDLILNRRQTCEDIYNDLVQGSQQ
jgi:hypothetical protein